MTREEIIQGLEMSYTYSNVDGGNTLVPQELVIDALALLKAQEPRVLTLAEVVARRGEPAYMESKSAKGYKGYVLIYDVQEGMGITGVRIGVTKPGHITIWPSKDIYGVKWRCWTARPTDKQREATPWET